MTALNALGDAVAQSLKEWLGESSGPSAKRHASAEASASGSEPSGHGGKRPGKGQSSNPFTSDQNFWLRGALQDFLGAFGRHVGARVDAVEQRAATLEENMKQVVEGLQEHRGDTVAMKAALDAESANRERLGTTLSERLEQLRTELTEYKQAAAGASTAASGGRGRTPTRQSSSVHWAGTHPLRCCWSERRRSWMRCFPRGWRRCRWCQSSTRKVRAARSKRCCRVPWFLRCGCASRRSFSGARGAVWLDHRRSMKDAASARMIHKLFDAVAELEEQRADSHTIVKKVASRQLWRQNGQRVAWLPGLRVCWSPWAASRYQAVDMATAVRFAEDKSCAGAL